LNPERCIGPFIFLGIMNLSGKVLILPFQKKVKNTVLGIFRMYFSKNGCFKNGEMSSIRECFCVEGGLA